VDAVATRVAEIARAAGLSSAFVSPSGSGAGAITLTGWVALAALAASAMVGLALAVLGVRRYVTARRGGGGGNRYTMVVKEGDV
jgi:Golgi apparatus protein 1